MQKTPTTRLIRENKENITTNRGSFGWKTSYSQMTQTARTAPVQQPSKYHGTSCNTSKFIRKFIGTLKGPEEPKQSEQEPNWRLTWPGFKNDYKLH